MATFALGLGSSDLQRMAMLPAGLSTRTTHRRRCAQSLKFLCRFRLSADVSGDGSRAPFGGSIKSSAAETPNTLAKASNLSMVTFSKARSTRPTPIDVSRQHKPLLRQTLHNAWFAKIAAYGNLCQGDEGTD